MFRVIDNRDSGKTKKLLQECYEEDGLFVCKHPERVEEKCRAYGIGYVEAIDYNTFIEQKFKTNKRIYIDELENFLKYMMPRLCGYCISKE